MKFYLTYTVFAMMKIGVLDIQGSVEEHMTALERLEEELTVQKKGFPKNKGKIADLALRKPKKEMVPNFGETFQPVLVKTVEQLRQVRGLIIPGGESTTIGKLLRRFGLREEIIKLAKEGKLAVWGTCAGAILLAKKILGKQQADSLNLMDIVVERNAYGRQLESFETQLEFDLGSPMLRSERAVGKAVPKEPLKNIFPAAVLTFWLQIFNRSSTYQSDTLSSRFKIFAQNVKTSLRKSVFQRFPNSDAFRCSDRNGPIPDASNGAGGAGGRQAYGGVGIPGVFIRAPRIVSIGKGVKILAEYNGEVVAVRQKNLLATNFHPEMSNSLEVHKYFVGMCGN